MLGFYCFFFAVCREHFQDFVSIFFTLVTEREKIQDTAPPPLQCRVQGWGKTSAWMSPLSAEGSTSTPRTHPQSTLIKGPSPHNATSVAKCKHLMSLCLSLPLKKFGKTNAKKDCYCSNAKIVRSVSKKHQEGRRQQERVHLCLKKFSPSMQNKCYSLLCPHATGQRFGRVVIPPMQWVWSWGQEWCVSYTAEPVSTSCAAGLVISSF